MKANKFIIISTEKSTGKPSMSQKPHQHETEALAKAEAARLATLDKKKAFTVLKVVATASVDEVNWS